MEDRLEELCTQAAGGMALLIAICTISMQSIKAAVANPVKSLRSE